MLNRLSSLTCILATTLSLVACSDTSKEEAPQEAVAITAGSFKCIQDMTPVRGFFVDSLTGDLDATLAIARSETGGTYPVGSLVQLVPTEAMVKREAGFDAATNDWEFFELVVSKEETSISVRGSKEAVNRFGGNCLECHAKAEPQWDLICESDHGCDPLPFTPEMKTAIQKTDPRCAPMPLSDEEKEALQILMESMG